MVGNNRKSLLRGDGVEPGRFNITIAAGQGAGKTTLQQELIKLFTADGYDYAPVTEVVRELKHGDGGIGNYESVSERFPMWEEQEAREDEALRLSPDACGIITDAWLPGLFVDAEYWNKRNPPQDETRAAKESWALDVLYKKKCLKALGRYQLVVLVKDPFRDFPFVNDTIRGSSTREDSVARNARTIEIAEKLFEGKTLEVNGQTPHRAEQVYRHVINLGVLRKRDVDPGRSVTKQT